MIRAEFRVGDVVELTAPIVRRQGRVTLPAGWQMRVKKLTRFGGSPEYTAEDTNGDTWENVPQSRLALVATAAQADAADEYEPEFEGSLF